MGCRYRDQSLPLKALDSQTRRLEDAIDEHTQHMDRRIRAVRKDMQQGFRAAADALHRTQADNDRRFARVYGDMNNGFAQVGGAMRQQAAALQQAAAQASHEQEILFRRSQEEAHYQDRLNRKCAEELARNGKYGFWSNCK
jgi:septal ring factor EnvC (AmiA/AmiB activator)